MKQICPNCGAMVRAGALYCGTCRQPLSAQSIPAPGGAPPAPGGGSAATAYLQAEDGQRFPLTASVTRIGREPTGEVVLTDSLVSGRHAEVEQDAGGYVLHDLGSTNGTYVNNQRIVGDCRLSDGDVVLVGNARLTFCVGISASAGIVPIPKTQAATPAAVQSALPGVSQPQVPPAQSPMPFQQPSQQPPSPQASKDFWSRLFGPRVVGRVPFEPKETQEQPPTDFSRLMVTLVVMMMFLTAIGAFVATMMMVAILLVCLGAGACFLLFLFFSCRCRSCSAA